MMDGFPHENAIHDVTESSGHGRSVRWFDEGNEIFDDATLKLPDPKGFGKNFPFLKSGGRRSAGVLELFATPVG